MSHIATLNLIDVKSYVDNCDSLLNQILREKENINRLNIKIDTDSLINNINSLKEIFLNQVGKVIDQKLLSNLSRLEKETININLMFHNTLMNEINQLLDKNEINYDEKIKSYGTMFFDVIEYMKNNNLPMTSQQFDIALNKVRDQNIETNRRNEFITNCFKYIDSLKIPSIMKSKIKMDVREIKTAQEMSDVFPLIQSKILEFERLNKTTKDLNNQLKELGFFLPANSKIEYSVDDYSNYVIKYSLKNSNNNIIQLIINSEGNVKYKLGNYVGHMCNKTSEKFIEGLKKQGYYVHVISVKRDIDNNKPLAFEQEIGK